MQEPLQINLLARPLDRQARRMTAARVDGSLRGSRRDAIGVEGATATVGEVAATRSEDRPRADGRAAGQGAAGDGTQTLGRLESEAAARRRGREGRACARRVPRATRDDAAVGAATADDIHGARAAERGTRR